MSLAFERFAQRGSQPGAQSSQGATGGAGLAGATPGPLATSAQPSKILQDVLDCIQTLKSGFEEEGSPIDDNNQTLHRFCAKLEYLLQADMKEKKTITGRRKDYWEYFCECLGPVKGVNDGIKYVKTTGDCKTSLGKGRAFLRFALMHHRLADSIQQCASNGKSTSAWYGPKSVWLQHDKSNMIISALYDLNDLQFDLAPRGYDLDNAWPSFARKSDTQHTWLLSERARTMSISSLNSIGQDSPMKTSMASTPIDQSDLDHLAQELAISETVRSDMSDRMEALAQQKEIFQSTLAESRGEMNILETQLRELQTEHKELQGHHRELEKQYDKLCMESEMKQRDGKSQETNFETKLSELKAENEALSHKISAINEDFQLAQENLHITTSERDNFQKECKVLSQRIGELETQIEDKQRQINEKVSAFETEKAEMVGRLRVLEDDASEKAKAAGDIQGELRDQSAHVTNLEKKVAAMAVGYRWLGNIKDGCEFKEIPDLDATSALSLKDVHHYVNSLQEKVLSSTQVKEKVSEENKSLGSLVNQYQQEAVVCKEKVSTMEAFVSKLQENEQLLKLKVSELEEAIKEENEKFLKLRNEQVETERTLADSRAQIQHLETEYSGMVKKFESKEIEIVEVREDVLKQKNELQKTTEYYNLATKGQSDLMEKMSAQEAFIQEKSKELMEMSEKEKNILREKSDLEREKLVLIGDRDDIMLKRNIAEKELNDAKHIMEKMKEEQVNYTAEKQRLLSTINELEKRVNDKDGEILHLQHSKENEKEKFDRVKVELERDNSNLMAELKSSSDEKNQIRNELNSAQNENKHLDREICVLKEKQSTLENTLLKMEENEEKYSKRLETAEKDLYSKSISYVSLEKDIEIKCKEIETLTSESNQTKLEFKSIQDQLYEKQSEASVLTEKLARSQEEIERIKEFYATAAKTESDLSERFKILENNLQDKDNRISSLTENEKVLSVELSKITRDKEDAMKSLEKLQTEMEDLKMALSDKQCEIGNLNMQISNLTVEKDSVSKKIQDMEQKDLEYQEDLNRMRTVIEKTSTEKDVLQNLLQERDRNVSDIEKENRILEQKLFEMEERESSVTKTLDVMKVDFDITSCEKEKLERQVQNLEQKCQENKSEIEKLNIQCEVVLEENNMTLSKLQEKDAVLTVEMQKSDKLKKEYDILSNDKYELEENVETLQKASHLSVEKIKQLEQALLDAETNQSSLDERIQELQEKDAKLLKEMETLNRQLEDSKQLNLGLTENKSELEKQLLSLNSQRDCLQSDYDTQIQDIEHINEENKSLKGNISQKKEEIIKLQRELSDSEKSRQKLADDLLVFQEKESNNVDTIRKLEETIQRAELEKDSIQGSLSLKSVEINELQARFDDFQSENSCLVQEYDLLQQSFNDLKITEEVVRAKLSEMTSDRDELNTEMIGVKELLKVTQVQLHKETSDKDNLLIEKELADKLSNELKQQMHDVEKSKAEIETQYRDVIERKDSFEKKLNEVESEMVVKVEEFKIHQSKFQDLESECVEKNSTIADLEKTNIHISTEKLEADSIIQQQQKLIDEQNVKIEQFNLAQIELENKCKELQEKLDELTHCEQQLAESINAVKQLQCDIDCVGDEKRKLQTEFEIKERNYEDKIIELEQDKKQLAMDVDYERNQAQSLLTKSAEDKSFHDRLEDTVIKLEKEKNDIAQQSQELCSRLSVKIEELESAVTHLTEENKKIALERDTLHEREKEFKDLNVCQQNEIASLGECNASLKSKVSGTEIEIIQLKEQLDKFEREKDDCEKELRKSHANSEAKRIELEKHLEEAVSDLQVIKVELSDTTAKLEQVYSEKQNLDTINENSRTENDKLMEEIENLQEQMEQKKTEYDKLLEDFNNIKTQNSDVEHDKDNLIKEKETLQEEICCIKDDVEQKLKEKDAESSSLLQIIDELRKTVEDASRKEIDFSFETEKLEKEIEEISEEIARKDNNIEELTLQFDKISSEKDILNERIVNMEQTVVQKDTTISIVNVELKNLTEQNEQLRAEADGIRGAKMIIEESESKMTEQINTTNKQNAELLDQNKTLTEQLEKTEQGLEQKKSDICCLEEKLAEVELKLSNLQSQNEKKAQDSEAEMDSLREEVSALEFQLSSKQLEEEKAQKSEFDNAEFREMKDKVMEQETIIDQLQREMADLRIISQKHRDQEVLIEKLNQELDNKTSENRVIRDELSTLREDLNNQLTSSLTVQNKYGDEKNHLEDQLRQRDEEIKQLQGDTVELKKKLVKLIREKDSLWQKTDRLTFQQKLQVSEKWMDDAKVTHCLGCSSEFSFTLRKHHCRLCGRIFCHNCSSNWVLAAHSSKKSRACTECYIRYTTAQREEEDGREDSDVEQSIEIPKPRVLGRSATGGASMNTSMASSTSSDPEVVQEGAAAADKTYDMSGSTGPGGDKRLAVSAMAETGGNETDEDKLKDSATNIGEERVEDSDRFHVVSDEEIQRSLSLSEDTETMAKMDPNVTCSMLVSLDELERGEVNSQNEVWIKPGRAFIVPVRITKPDTVFGWEFTSYPKDVVFSVTYRASLGLTLRDGQSLVPQCKCDSHKQVTKGELTAKQVGIYTLMFDNAYSRLTSKRINYALFSNPPSAD